LWAALWHGWRFRKLTHTSFWALLKEAWSMRRHSELTLAQTAMAAAAPMLTRAALVEGKPEVGILPTGQNVGVIDELPTVAELLTRIVHEAETVLATLAPPATGVRRALS
jgi:NAD(P)H-dependent flavin oxidoreductase YrpB (nitropropane dioxygenase family)